MTRSILIMLRKLGAPQDVLTITLRLIEEREKNQSDKKLVPAGG